MDKQLWKTDKSLYRRTFEAIDEIKGPLVFLKAMPEAMYGGIIEIIQEDGTHRVAQIIDASDKAIIAQVFEGTYNLERRGTLIFQYEDIFHMPVSDAMLGIPLSGLGEPLDPTILISPVKYLDVTSNPINPSARDIPRSPIETGIPAIDCMNTLVKGQKLPIFTAPGLPASQLAVTIAQYIASNDQLDLYVVFGAMGITQREGKYYQEQLGQVTGSDKIAFFLNFIEHPTVERILTPRCALTYGEYLAFEQGHDVLVILSDMLNYAQSLREVAAAREEIPGRRGYPGYLYTDMASIYERAGRIRNKPGSLTQIPVVTMPNSDITHPVPDLTGYSTEGQIVLSTQLYYKDITIPIDVSPSLSRLMNSGIGEGFTRGDHKAVSNQLYAVYSEGRRLQDLSQITGEESLTNVEKLYLSFVDLFEQKFLQQTGLSFAESLDLGWKLLGILPQDELSRIPVKLLEHYYRPYTLSELEAM